MTNSKIIGVGQGMARYAPEINTITCGDCLQVMKQIPDKSIDMILCDLPYGTTACKWDVVIPFEPLWVQYKRIIKDRGCIALFGSEPFSSYLRISNIKNYKYDWIWFKNHPSGFALAKKQPMRIHETISVFYGGNYYPIKENRNAKKETINRYSYGLNGNGRVSKNRQQNGIMPITQTNIDLEKRYPTSVKYFEVVPRCKMMHPTQKPVALLEYFIHTYTNEGDTVLDNCIGSGTTAIACINTRRNFIGIEKEEKYCQIAEERIRALRSPVQNTKETRHTAMLKIFFTF